MTRYVSALLLIVLTTAALAQGPPEVQPRGLSDSARKEIIRRGYISQVVSDEASDDGTERACMAAGETPKDDSDKFNLTVLYGKFRTEQIDKLRDALLSPGDELSAWVECKNRNKGTYDVYSTEASHLHVRFEQVPSVGDPEKWKGHDKFPTLVFQTPYSGRFGKPGLTIDFRVGYDGDQKAIAEWLQTTLEKFAKSRAAAPTREYMELRNKRFGALIKSEGHAGHRYTTPGAHEDIGGAAPFYVTPQQLPVGENLPGPFPPNFAPTEPKALTFAEIQQAAPGAPADFLVAQLSAGAKDKAAVAAAWAAKQQADAMAKQQAEFEKRMADLAKQLEEAKQKPTGPSQPVDQPTDPPETVPVVDWLLRALAGSGVLLLLLKVGLDLWRGPAKLSPNKLDDVAVAIGDGIVAVLDKKLNKDPSPKG
jgi:hypothetical protein